MPAIEENYDVVVVGAGHAGCEAALACARLGLETIIFTVSVDSIAMMPCNPNIGGSSKGHLVREIDALGGQMGINIDKTFIQSKMLNKSKGPAVHSLRAQADKVNYSMEMRKTLQNTEHLTIRQAEVAEIITIPVNSDNSGKNATADKNDGQVVEIGGELQKDVLILYTDGIEENGRVIRTPDFAAVLKPKTDSNGEQICDEYGNPEFEAEREEFGEKRIYEIIEAVFQKKKYILTKKDNPSAGEILEFDFTNCQGTVEEATLALASLEKLFRLYKPTSATVKDLVEVDVAIDGFLKKYFSLYKEYAVPPTQESFHGRPVRKPKNPNNVFYSCIKEDSQEDDLTIVCLQRN